MSAGEALINPVQRASLRAMLPHVPNERRLAVIEAYTGISVRRLRRAAGLTESGCDTACRPEIWIARAWRLAAALGLTLTELFDIDDHCDPQRWLGVRAPGSRRRLELVRSA